MKQWYPIEEMLHIEVKNAPLQWQKQNNQSQVDTFLKLKGSFFGWFLFEGRYILSSFKESAYLCKLSSKKANRCFLQGSWGKGEYTLTPGA